ncbi:uncharacterized protein LOC107981267 [Nasonia vitripennis]|uniref:Uncharacterized protein n=1 Tax=Nasonia vitripennis TaxID=7425 RepID=A0A7M7TEF1_NASVI|nr:uncharacterized protein LOC107981267 [Nasonia vitripennis]
MCEKIKQIKIDFRTLKKIVENQFRGKVGAGGRDRPIDLLPQLPIKDVEVFDKFNRDLETNDLMQTQLKNFMTSIGGKTLEKSMRNGLEAIISNELGRNTTGLS